MSSSAFSSLRGRNFITRSDGNLFFIRESPCDTSRLSTSISPQDEIFPTN
jgi:hypothetical protein